MSTSGTSVPAPAGGPPWHAHKHRQKERHIGWLLVGICVVGGLAVPVAHQLMPRYKPRTGTAAALPLEVEPKLEFSLAEAAFQGEGARRTIVGTVRNLSGERQTEVVVAFKLYVNSNSVAGLAIGKIPSIEPHAVGRFQTNPVAPEVRRFFLRDIAAGHE